ncbi:MAG TPA: UMP kinase [Candidatus Paceibacterota bacterium]|nr:UMP kinase [Candidatus Paceibacterota bacterium]HPT18272.1 UMP kinase [Candidatus Paceibacterota bacterium]
MKEEIIVISLGGSLIVPDQVDVEFLKDFKELILSQVKNGKKFVIVTGGGKFCRRYQEALKNLTLPSGEDLDWLGTYSTRFNAEFLRLIFGELACNEIITDPTLPISFDHPIVIGSGWKPGWSSDYDGILLAKSVGAKKMINLSNTDYVYDSDPKLNPNAQKIERISWKEYRELIPKEWNPGLNSPFDPIASEMAEREGIEVTIMNGKPISNLESYINGEDFQGTIIY